LGCSAGRAGRQRAVCQGHVVLCGLTLSFLTRSMCSARDSLHWSFRASKAPDREAVEFAVMEHRLLFDNLPGAQKCTNALNTQQATLKHKAQVPLFAGQLQTPKTWTATCAWTLPLASSQPKLAHAGPWPTLDRESLPRSADTPRPPGRRGTCGCPPAPRPEQQPYPAQARRGAPAAAE